ncbi:MAG: thiamine diphosphokinase [Oscillospiraceae bacterium]|jgi:thiamine pyrophosphokinase|nr:thiamine diphosphokinase [Oscillospiraceae bacterium]
MKSCAIVGAGEFNGFHPCFAGEYTIAADGGCDNLAKFGITPDLIVGDCDSISEIPGGVEVVRAPSEKDETDAALAVNEAIRRGYVRFYIYGALGGRLDHTLANISLLANLSRRGFTARIIGKNEIIAAVTDGVAAFGADKTGIISIFPAGEKAKGVSLKGLKYGLDDAELRFDAAVGVSNEFIGEESFVGVKKGTLIIVTGA